MDQWALLLKLMTEPKQYRPVRPVVPITQPVAILRAVSPADQKLLDDYSRTVARCGTGRVVKDVASGFYVPELDAACALAK